MACDPEVIARQINTRGFSMVADYIAPDNLARTQAAINAILKQNAGTSIILRGPCALAGTLMDELPRDPAFARLCRHVYEAGTGNPAPDSACYQVLRCLTGDACRSDAMLFHFDSYVLAALVPIIMPTGGRRGDLLLAPNVRKVRKSYAVNLLDKAFLATRFEQRRLTRMYSCGDPRLVRVQLVPGNLYFFWGYMSAHTNERCDADKVRSTALFHYVNPHAASGLSHIISTNRLKDILHPRRLASRLLEPAGETPLQDPPPDARA
jgi:hypothetical protein